MSKMSAFDILLTQLWEVAVVVGTTKIKLYILTSCGGTSNETVLRSTLVYESVQGIMKNKPANQCC